MGLGPIGIRISAVWGKTVSFVAVLDQRAVGGRAGWP
jgi:hypothetical protein